MGLSEMLRYLEEEKERLLAGAADVKDLYRSLADSIRTLPVPFRRSFSPDSGLTAALDPERGKILFHKHNLQSSEGEVQNNNIGYSYIIGRESIESKEASLESLIGEVNRLEKHLLRVRDSIRSAQVKKKIKTISIAKIRDAIDSIRSTMRRVFEESFGLIQ